MGKVCAIGIGSTASMLPGEFRKYAISLFGFELYLMTMGNDMIAPRVSHRDRHDCAL